MYVNTPYSYKCAGRPWAACTPLCLAGSTGVQIVEYRERPAWVRARCGQDAAAEEVKYEHIGGGQQAGEKQDRSMQIGCGLELGAWQARSRPSMGRLRALQKWGRISGALPASGWGNVEGVHAPVALVGPSQLPAGLGQRGSVTLRSVLSIGRRGPDTGEKQ